MHIDARSHIPSQCLQALDKTYWSAMHRFESLARKPSERHDFLVQHGWPSDKCAKRKIDAQRDFLLEALCNGSSHNFEGEMFLGALKSMPVTSDVIKTACLSYSADDGFTASYKSSEASEWACSGR